MAESKKNKELSEKELRNVAGGKNQQHPSTRLGDSVGSRRDRSLSTPPTKGSSDGGSGSGKRRPAGLDDMKK